jgi:hypothetical protein
VFSFTLTENGTSTDFDGSANWTEGTSSGGEQAFGIIFNTPDQTTSGLLTREGSAPSSGSYSIASLQSAALVPLTDFSFYIVTDAAGDNLPTTYLSTGGSLAINSASSNSIAGSFNLNLVRFEIVNGQQQEIPATLNGTFTASQVTTIGIID